MNIRELKESVDAIVKYLQAHENPRVTIELAERSMPAKATMEVTEIWMGFDWNAGQIILKTEKPVVTKPKKEKKP